MSDKRGKIERAKAKDARQSPVLDKLTKRAPSKKVKPFTVMFKWKNPAIFRWSFNWHLMGKYARKEVAEKAISDDKRMWPDKNEYTLTEK